MADIDINQAEADALIVMEKRCADERQQWLFPAPGDRIVIALTSLDKREHFMLDVTRAQIKLTKATYQNRARQALVLMRCWTLTVRRTEIPTGPKSRVPTYILTEKVSVTNGPSRPPSIAIPTQRTCFPPAKLSRSTATSQDHPRCRRGCSHECGRDRKTSPRLPHLASG